LSGVLQCTTFDLTGVLQCTTWFVLCSSMYDFWEITEDLGGLLH
jgi:hypothetical protein